MGNQHEWLLKELCEWEKEGIVDQKVAQTLRGRYAHQKSTRASTLLGVLGVLMVGLGVIVLLAYNWDGLGRTQKGAIAIGLLLFAQLLAVWVKRYRGDVLFWQESSGVLWFLMVGASLGLVMQTYQLGGELVSFFHAWLFLGFAIMILMPSFTVAFFQLTLINWVLNTPSFFHSNSLFDLDRMGLVALLVVWFGYCIFWMRNTQSKYAIALLRLSLLINFLLFIRLEVLPESFSEYCWHALPSLLAFAFSALFLFGRMLLMKLKGWFLQDMYEFIGLNGMFLLLLAFSFNETWRLIATYDDSLHVSWRFIAVCIVYCAVVVAWIIRGKKEPTDFVMAVLPFVFLFCWAMGNGANGVLMWVVIHIAFYVSALWAIYHAIKIGLKDSVVTWSLYSAVMILAHFFSSEYGLLAKGIVFIVVGCGFFAINMFAINKAKGINHEN